MNALSVTHCDHCGPQLRKLVSTKWQVTSKQLERLQGQGPKIEVASWLCNPNGSPKGMQLRSSIDQKAPLGRTSH